MDLSKDHVLTILCRKIRTTERNTHELPSFFFENIVSVRESRDQTVGKEHVWSCKVQDTQEFKQKEFGSHGLEAECTDIYDVCRTVLKRGKIKCRLQWVGQVIIKSIYCNPNYFWRISNVTEAALFICSGGKQGGNYLRWRSLPFFFSSMCEKMEERRQQQRVLIFEEQTAWTAQHGNIDDFVPSWEHHEHV
jgi:hypothetical protein